MGASVRHATTGLGRRRVGHRCHPRAPLPSPPPFLERVGGRPMQERVGGRPMQERVGGLIKNDYLG
jgi:hypothetical protein